MFGGNVWKVSKYGVCSGPYFPGFRPNTATYGPEKLHILSLFTQGAFLFRGRVTLHSQF